MDQTYGNKGKRYISLRDEWIRNLQVKLTRPVEELLREFFKAATIAHAKRSDLAVEDSFLKFVVMSRSWDDDKMLDVIGRRTSEDAAIALQNAVKSHAMVLSFSAAVSTKQQLEVPNIVKFFRSIIESSTRDLAEMKARKEGDISIFGSADTAQRKRARLWISEIIKDKCFDIVPVAMFARAPSPVIRELVEERTPTPPPPPAPVAAPAPPVATVAEAPAALVAPVVAPAPVEPPAADIPVTLPVTPSPPKPSGDQAEEEDDDDEEEDDEDEEAEKETK